MKLLCNSLAWGSGGCWVCFFISPASAGLLFDFLFSENVTFVDRGRPLFLRGFVISCHLVKCSKSLHNKRVCRVRKHLGFWMMRVHALYVLVMCMYEGFDSKMLYIQSVNICATELIILSSNFSSYLDTFKDHPQCQ